MDGSLDLLMPMNAIACQAALITAGSGGGISGEEISSCLPEKSDVWRLAAKGRWMDTKSEG